MRIAAEICIYTNENITIEEIEINTEGKEKKSSKDKRQ